MPENFKPCIKCFFVGEMEVITAWTGMIPVNKFPPETSCLCLGTIFKYRGLMEEIHHIVKQSPEAQYQKLQLLLSSCIPPRTSQAVVHFHVCPDSSDR